MGTLKSLFLFLLLAGCTPLFAQQAGHIQKAEEYLLLTGAEQRMGKTMSLARQSMAMAMEKQPAFASLPPEAVALTREFQEAVLSLLEKTLTWESLKEDMVRITAETFNERELDDMIAFLKTPAGRVMTERADSLMEKGAAIGQQRSMAIQPELLKLSQEFAQKLRALQPAPAKPRP